AAKSPDRQPTPDNFAERGEVRANPKQLLDASASHSEPGHHFIENQKGSVAIAFGAQCLKKVFAREIESGVCRDGLKNDCRDRSRIFAKGGADRFEVVE